MEGAPTTATSPPLPGESRRGAWRATIDAALSPVTDALTGAARARAQAIGATAEADARTQLAAARHEADRLLAEARDEGDHAGGHAAAALLAASHREARAILLAARRRAYELLRQRAYELLLLQAVTQEGQQLSRRLETLVRNRVGASGSVRRVGPGGLGVVAEAGSRRAACGPSELVEQALVSLGPEIESLWA